MTHLRFLKLALIASALAGFLIGPLWASDEEPVKVTVSKVLSAPAQYDNSMLEVSGHVWTSTITYRDGYPLTNLKLVNLSEYSTKAKAAWSWKNQKFLTVYLWGKWGFVRGDSVFVVGTFYTSLVTTAGKMPNAIRGMKARKSGR